MLSFSFRNFLLNTPKIYKLRLNIYMYKIKILFVLNAFKIQIKKNKNVSQNVKEIMLKTLLPNEPPNVASLRK